MIEAFSPAVSDGDLRDLSSRLRATRWPEPATDPGQGVALDELQGLCRYWAEEYDWRACERRLAEVGQYRTTVNGLGIQFLHARSPDPEAIPLVLTHGWPGSVLEFLDALPLLTAAGFHCVVPSLPGYGWSGKPTRSGWDVHRIASAWAGLMAELGYDRYGASGGDWGTSVTAGLGQQDPEHVLGVHLVPPLAPPRPSMSPTEDHRPDDQSGYSEEQRTRPQTIGYSLTDSPAGLAGWVTEKVRAWSDPRSRIALDRELDNLMFYWLPRAGASAARLYWESLHDVRRWLTGPLEDRDLVHVPAGGSVFPYELQQPVREDAEQRFTDLRYWGQPARGGHFAAWEEPELFTAEVQACFAALR